MDIAGIVVIVVVVIVLLALCSYCCKRHRGKVLGPPQQTGVTITTATTSASVAHPPYPITAHHPVPQMVPAPALGFQTPPHVGYPYPVGHAPGYYYPPPQMGPVMPQPYPPQPGQPVVAPPPSYHEAVGQPVAQPPPIHESYAKQAPYNPNY